MKRTNVARLISALAHARGSVSLTDLVARLTTTLAHARGSVYLLT